MYDLFLFLYSYNIASPEKMDLICEIVLFEIFHTFDIMWFYMLIVRCDLVWYEQKPRSPLATKNAPSLSPIGFHADRSNTPILTINKKSSSHHYSFALQISPLMNTIFILLVQGRILQTIVQLYSLLKKTFCMLRVSLTDWHVTFMKVMIWV